MQNIARILLLIVITGFISCVCYSKDSTAIQPGAHRMEVYLPLLQHKRIGIMANQTSEVAGVNLIDTLLARGVNIVKIFSPEHGFRGTADAGETTGNYTDNKTGIQVISLYGKKKKPDADDVKDIDFLLFDIQDVGVRFYTYISSLQYFMEGAFENHKPLMILDRPNPNGFYVDGPVLDTTYKSFIGMQPVPVVYGMTIGEYAMMIAGEKWLYSQQANKTYSYYKTADNSADTPFHFLVIKCGNYDHNSLYQLPVKPSPNLPDMSSVYWYPSTCFFEGTALSEGRGTDKPFQVFGHPSLPKNLYAFTPTSRPGATAPKLVNQQCYGWNISGSNDEVLKKINHHIQLGYLLKAYQLFNNKDSFFIKPSSGNMHDCAFNKLTGSAELMKQIIAGKSEKNICESWQPALNAFKKIRKKYLLYKDFESHRSPG